MSDTPRSKIGPIQPEAFDGEVAPRAPGEVESKYSSETNAEFDRILAELRGVPDQGEGGDLGSVA